MSKRMPQLAAAQSNPKVLVFATDRLALLTRLKSFLFNQEKAATVSRSCQIHQTSLTETVILSL